MSTTTFEWDEQNNLSAMTLPGGSREEYVYSADGLRRQKKVNGSVTHYIWDEQNLLQEKDASLQTQVQYTTQPHGYGPILSQRRFGGASQSSAQFNAVGFGSSQFNQGGSSPAVAKSTFYGTDLSGNVRNLTDSSGAVTDRYVTTAFGKPISSTGSTTNPYRFGGSVGYYQDNAQRYYVRKRYLNTNQARWISPDPIGFNGRDWNLYRYVGNNPITHNDPTGLRGVQRKSSSGMCGLEVQNELNKMFAKLKHAFFYSWPEEKQLAHCRALTTVINRSAEGAWDIYELSTAAGTSQGVLDIMHRHGCATNHCDKTVSVDKKCHYMWAVNYSLLGAAFRLCGNLPSLYDKVLPCGAWALCHKWDPLCLFENVKDYYSEKSAGCLIDNWNAYKSKKEPQKYSPGDAKVKKAWMHAGYEGIWTGKIIPPGQFSLPDCNCCPNSQKIISESKIRLQARWDNGGYDGDTLF